MKRKNNDLIILIISFVINMLILFLSPGINMDEIIDKKLKVGLVTLEKTPKRQTIKPTGKKQVKNIKKEEASEKKKFKPKKIESKKINKLSLDDLEQSIAKRDPEILITKDNSKNRVKESDLKKKLLGKKNLNQLSQNNVSKLDNIDMDKKSELKESPTNYDFYDPNDDIILENDKDSNNNLEFKSIVEKDGAEGLPSGYKLGVEDGDVVAKWDPSNREPVYPEAALQRGMQGKVKLKMRIDESGKVSSVYIEKGSGVPEINEAIEKIARTWKIYLNKNGLNIKGNVTLEYSFKLIGTSN